MILIVASEIDPHVDSVVSVFHNIGYKDFLRIDLGTSFTEFSVSFFNAEFLRAEWLIKSNNNNLCVSPENLTSVWWRRSASIIEDSLSPNPVAERADVNECAINTKQIIESIDRKYFPFGHPACLRRSENKFLQLAYAHRVNFRIPRFIFSNNREEVLEFLSVSRDVVIKVIGLNTIKKDDDSYGFTAVRINSVDLSKKLKNIKAALFIQDEVKRVTDVRLVFTFHFAYAFAISVDSLPINEIDWRPFTFQCAHQQISIPQDIREKCERFLKLMNLEVGHFDFIIDFDGNWVFLECNPNGQWLWLEEMTGAPLSREFAFSLMR